MCSRSAVRRPRITKRLLSSINRGAVAQLGEHLLCNYSSLSAVLPSRAPGPKSAQLCAVKSGRLFGIRSPLTAFYHATRGLKFCGRRSSPRASRTGAVPTGIPKESCRGGAPATKGVGRPLRSSSRWSPSDLARPASQLPGAKMARWKAYSPVWLSKVRQQRAERKEP